MLRTPKHFSRQWMTFQDRTQLVRKKSSEKFKWAYWSWHWKKLAFLFQWWIAREELAPAQVHYNGHTNGGPKQMCLVRVHIHLHISEYLRGVPTCMMHMYICYLATIKPSPYHRNFCYHVLHIQIFINAGISREVHGSAWCFVDRAEQLADKTRPVFINGAKAWRGLPYSEWLILVWLSQDN